MEKNNMINLIIIIIVVGIIVVGANYIIMEQKTDAMTNTYQQEISNLEEEIVYHNALEYGGEENYEIAEQLYTSEDFQQQQYNQLQQMLEQEWIQGWEEDELSVQEAETSEQEEDAIEYDNLPDPAEVWEVEVSVLEEIMESTYIQNEEWTELVWIEYSDIMCPFCQRQHEDWTVKEVMDEYEEEISWIYRHFPVQSPVSEEWAEGILCVEDMGTKDQYFEYIEKLYELDDIGDRNAWSELADDIGIDSDEFDSCIEEWRFDETQQEHLQEWQQIFGVTWTPWNVIANKETGEFILIPWAFPANVYDEVIQNLTQ